MQSVVTLSSNRSLRQRASPLPGFNLLDGLCHPADEVGCGLKHNSQFKCPMSYYQYHLFVCTHQREEGETCCANHEANDLLAYAKEQLKTLKLSGANKCRINKSGCMDRCNKGPVLVVYPEGIWYRYQTKQDIDEIISEHLQAGRVVERLQV